MFHVVEIDFESPLISQTTLTKFANQLSKRKTLRLERAKLEWELNQQKEAAERLTPGIRGFLFI